MNPTDAGFQSGPKQLVFHPVPSSACLTTPCFPASPPQAPRPGSSTRSSTGSSLGGQSAATGSSAPSSLLSSSCCSFVILSIASAMADEQSAGLHHVRPLLCVPGGQRPSEDRIRVPLSPSSGKSHILSQQHGQSLPAWVVGSVTSWRQQAHSPGFLEPSLLADLKRDGPRGASSLHGAAPTSASCSAHASDKQIPTSGAFSACIADRYSLLVRGIFVIMMQTMTKVIYIHIKYTYYI